MKKTNLLHRIFLERKVLKTMLLMKLSFVILLATSLQVAAKTYSQERVSVEFKNTTVEKALKELKQKSNYRFVYSSLKLPADMLITYKAIDAPVKDILDVIFTNSGLSYQVLDNNLVVITSLEAPVPPRTVTGKITNEKGEPVAGATIQVKGGNALSTSASDGSFSLTVDDKVKTLVISFVGMETMEVNIQNKSNLSILMRSLETALDDVVVVGYGNKTKTTVTGAVSVVNASQLANRPAANVVNSLQGLVPGLVITRGNVGRVGREADNLGVEIRGIASRSNPGTLFVVDGIPQQSGGAFSLNNVNPEDIENITVLKDAQAAIYGSRAAGGVILITTKSGKSITPVIAINSNFSINTPGIVRKQANIIQAIDMWTESYENDGVANNYYSHLKPFLTSPPDLNTITVAKGPFPDTKDITLSNNDWMKIMWGSALQQQHSVSVSGKTARSAYWFSLGVLDQQSMIQYGTNYNRKYNVRMKYDFDVTNYLKIKTNFSIQTQKLVEPTDYDNIENITAFSFAGKAKYTQSGKYYGFGGYLSTIGWAEQGGNREAKNTQIRGQVEAILTPIKNLEITGQLAINRDQFDEFALRTGFLSYTYDDDVIFNSNAYWGGRDQVTAGYSKNDQLVGNLYANYRYYWKDHHFNLLAGLSHEEVETRAFSAYRNGNPYLLNNNLSFLGNGALTEQFNSETRGQYALNSDFARLSYDFKQKYFFEGNFRYDASSKFAPGHQGTAFFGASAGWVLTGEKFMQPLHKVLDFAKIRVSYGELGNQSGIGLYDYIQEIAFGGQYPFGPQNSPLRSLSTVVPSLASPDRSWEKLAIQNIGLDMRFLSNRLSASIDVFSKTNKNLFYSKEFPAILGITPPQINGASLRTKGWELSLMWKDKVGKNFEYFTNLVVSDNTNKVLSLADSRIPGYGFNGFVEGYSYGTYFTYQYDGLIQTNAELAAYKSAVKSGIPTNIRTGDVKFKDLNGDGKLTPQLYNPADPSKGGDILPIGNSNIRYSYSVNLGANYKGFYFSAIFQGVGKWQVMDGNVAAVEFFRNPLAYHYGNTWKTTNTGALYPKTSQDGGIYGYNYLPSDAPFKNRSAAYLRLKNVQVGYNLSASLLKKVHVKAAQIFLSGTDLAEWSAIPVGFDPEKPFSIVNTPYPRTFSFGLNVSL